MVWVIFMAYRTSPQYAPKIALCDGINNSVFEIYCKWSVFAYTVTCTVGVWPASSIGKPNSLPVQHCMHARTHARTHTHLLACTPAWKVYGYSTFMLVHGIVRLLVHGLALQHKPRSCSSCVVRGCCVEVKKKMFTIGTTLRMNHTQKVKLRNG